MFNDLVTFNDNIVREFYVHIQDSDPQTDHFVTYVRGIEFTFSSTLIVTTLGLPRVDNDYLSARPVDDLPLLNVLATELYGIDHPRH